MISVKRLKELLEQVPDDAKVNAYEGETTGISITKGKRHWWIDAKEKYIDTYTEGFIDYSKIVTIRSTPSNKTSDLFKEWIKSVDKVIKKKKRVKKEKEHFSGMERFNY